ncbi:MAG: PAS domain S-box protein [Thermoplasmata archaeon]
MSIKILLVDDERSLIKQAKIFLERTEIELEVHTVPLAERALGLLDEKDFDVIVSDYQMPKMDGLEFLEVLRKERKNNIPFIMFTGKGREEVAMRALNLGADRYIQKGGDPKAQYGVLVDAIEQEYESWRSKKELKRSEKELRENRKRYKKIFYETPLGAFTYDDEGVITDCNDKFVEMMGSSREDLIGIDLVNDLENEELIEEVETSLEESSGYYEGEYTSVIGGRTSNIRVFFKGIEDEDGNIDSGVGLVEDISEKKEMEERLKESEEKYRALIESAFAGIGITDFQNNITFVNDKFADMLGYGKEELVGKNLREIAPEEELVKFEKETEKRKVGRTSQYESRLNKKNGEMINVIVHASPFKDADGEFVGTMGVVTDITERKEIEDKLKENERKLRQLYEMAPKIEKVEEPQELYELIIDTARDILDFDVCSVLIEKDEELMVRASTEKELIDDFSMPIDKGIAGKTFRNRRSYLINKILEDEDAEPTDSDFMSTISIPMSDIGVFQSHSYEEDYYDKEDLELAELFVSYVTEAINRMNTAKALKESERKFRTIIDNSADAIFLTDQEGYYTYTNQAALDLLGYTREEFKDMNIGDLSREEDIEKHLDIFEKVFKEKRVFTELTLVKKDGTTISVDLNTVLLPNGLIYGSCRDITERKELEKRIQENKDKLEKLNEISAKFQTYGSKEDLFSFAIDAAEYVLDFDICAINAPEGDFMKAVTTSSNFPKDASSRAKPLPIDNSLAGRTYLEKRSFLINDKDENEDINPTRDDFESGISVPIGKYGVFQAVSSEVAHFDEEDLKMAQLLTNHVSEALNRIEVQQREDFLHSLLRHDLGNMIQIIQGYVQLVEDQVDGETLEMIKRSEKATKNAQELIEKVRTLRDVINEDVTGTLDVSSVLDTIISDYEDILERENIELECDKKEMEVRGGPLLEELFSNILENSIKHSRCDQIRISCEVGEEEIVVKIEDDGKGISDEDKDRLFERGYKSGEESGSGLGLYLVKEIAESYGGNVEIKDSELGGARFDVRLKKDVKKGDDEDG